MARRGPKSKIERLERRMAHLEERVRAPRSDGQNHYDASELSALMWALSVLRAKGARKRRIKDLERTLFFLLRTVDYLAEGRQLNPIDLERITLAKGLIPPAPDFWTGDT